MSVLSARYEQPGWVEIGKRCSAGRRSLWMRLVWRGHGTVDRAAEEFLVAMPSTVEAIELCAGREGDDSFMRITHDDKQFASFLALFLTARMAAET